MFDVFGKLYHAKKKCAVDIVLFKTLNSSEGH